MSVSVLKVILVCFSSRGHQLVFSYPEDLSTTILGFEHASLADILSPKTSLCDQKFHLKVSNVDFVGHPTLLDVEDSTDLIYSRMMHKKGKSSLTMFNVVFALDKTQRNEVDLIHEFCLLKIANALKYEQRRDGYVREQSEIILNLKEMQGKTSKEVNELILEKSSLAASLKQVFDAMNGNSTPHIIFNKSSRLSLQVDVNKLALIHNPSSSFLSLRPYHGMLLLHDPEDIIRATFLDSSDLLHTFIRSVTSTFSFEYLQTVLDCSLAQIYRFAAHLYYWGQAIIIQTVSPRNFYVIAEEADLAAISKTKEEFEASFKNLDLVILLSDLSYPRPYHTIIPSKELRNLYLDAITFLFRHKLIVQLNMYIFLFIPDLIVCKVKEDDVIGVKESFMISDPTNLTPFEAKCVSMLRDSQPNLEVRALFNRLLMYMDGKHHLAEIIFQEKLTRKEVKLAMSSYRHEIVTSLHR